MGHDRRWRSDLSQAPISTSCPVGATQPREVRPIWLLLSGRPMTPSASTATLSAISHPKLVSLLAILPASQACIHPRLTSTHLVIDRPLSDDAPLGRSAPSVGMTGRWLRHDGRRPSVSRVEVGKRMPMTSPFIEGIYGMGGSSIQHRASSIRACHGVAKGEAGWMGGHNTLCVIQSEVSSTELLVTSTVRIPLMPRKSRSAYSSSARI